VLLNEDRSSRWGCEFIVQAKERGFTARTLLITGGMSAHQMQRMLANGCAGIFLRHGVVSELIYAIRRVADGEDWLDLRAVRVLVNGLGNSSLCNLSAWEQTVLAAVIQGESTKDISRSLQTSESRIKFALQRIFQKTGVRTRSGLVRVALDGRCRLAA